LTLETTVSDDDSTIMFCFEPGIGTNTWTEADDTNATFGVSWTNGEVYVDADTTTVDSVVVYGTYVDSTWGWDVLDAPGGEGDSGVWTEVTESTDFSCTGGGVCTGSICVSRANGEVTDEFVLPFVDGTSFIAYYSFINYGYGVVYSGAMSLGLALASAAGASLALM